MSQISRNAPCHCGATKPNGESVKYKSCHLAADEAQRKPQTGEDAIIVCMPTRGQICYETYLAINMNMGDVKRTFTMVGRKPVVQARNDLAKQALDIAKKNLLQFTPREWFVLFVDDDAWLPPGLVTAMLQCMREPEMDGLDALFAWFCARSPYAAPIAYRDFDDHESYPKIGIDCKLGDIVPIEAAGFHTVLMRLHLLEKLGNDPFTPITDEEGEDLAFCRRANAIGAKMGVATAMPSAHIDPRDGTAYMPGMPAMMMENNSLKALSIDHLSGSGAVKQAEVRAYGLDAAEAAIASNETEQRGAAQAEMEQRRKVMEGAV